MFERRIINHPWEGKMTPFKIKGIEGKKTAHVLFIDEKRNLEEEFSFTIEKESDVKIRLPKQTVAYIKVEE